ncbi:EAL domain-containing protein [Pandoraea sputorum]|uniref:cyclic-guanylate-specific phosphodiesterase n=2 Tax=Pandoraea sputorum TaxID=93222 RepID=A0A5E5APS2_9BURK|nr:EAL domain-containing protein [Pandoraea sputorum]
MIPVLVSIYVANEVVQVRSTNKLQDFAQRALLQADLVRGQILESMQDLQEISFSPCSAEYLRSLRRVAFSHRYVRDVGAYAEGRYLCSSLLGDVRTEKIVLSNPDWTTSAGNHVWVSPRVLFDQRQRDFLVGRAGRYVAVDPAMFVDIMNVGRRAISVVSTDIDSPRIVAMTPGNDAAQTLVAFGRGGTLKMSGWNYVTIHSTTYPHAVVVRERHSDVYVGSISDMAWFVVAGCILGALLGLTAFWLVIRLWSMPAALARAIKRNRVRVNYQPIVDMRTGRPAGVEALARWTHGSEIISPAVFIPVAEEHNLIQALTEAVTARALAELAPIMHEYPTFYVSLNVDPSELKTDRYRRILVECCERHAISPAQVKIEITERAVIDAESMQGTIRAFRSSGFAMYIDDFGTGYSSLGYLHKFEFDALKIDKSFVDAIGREAVSSPVVEHIIAMANSLRLNVIAEGVEHPHQAQFLMRQGVHFAQGWFFGKAVPAETLRQSLLSCISPHAGGDAL